MCLAAYTESGKFLGMEKPCPEYEALKQERDALSAENELSSAYAKQLANSLWRSRYMKEAPQWEPLSDTTGLISQIDNMIAGVMQDVSRLEWERDALLKVREAADKLAEVACRYPVTAESDPLFVSFKAYKEARHG